MRNAGGKKLLFVLFGLISAGLGTIGIVLPLLPTTPLFLLSSYFFVKSSPRLHKWLEGTKAYQKTAGAFLSTGGLTIKAKLSVLIPVLAMLAFMFFAFDNMILKIITVLLGTAKTVVFIRIKSIRERKGEKQTI